MQKLPGRKIAQIRRFFGNPKKAGAHGKILRDLPLALAQVISLQKSAERKGNLRKFSVFDIRIGKRMMTVKVRMHEDLQKRNLELMYAKYSEGVKYRVIKSKGYGLHIPDYAYADENVGIMGRISGPGFDTYISFLKKIASKRRPNLRNPKLMEIYKECIKFWMENPEVSIGKLREAKKNLNRDLALISKKGFLFSYDLYGRDNIRLLRHDRGKDIIHIAVLDQVLPYDMPRFARLANADKFGW